MTTQECAARIFTPNYVLYFTVDGVPFLENSKTGKTFRFKGNRQTSYEAMDKFASLTVKALKLEFTPETSDKWVYEGEAFRGSQDEPDFEADAFSEPGAEAWGYLHPEVHPMPPFTQTQGIFSIQVNGQEAILTVEGHTPSYRQWSQFYIEPRNVDVMLQRIKEKVWSTVSLGVKLSELGWKPVLPPQPEEPEDTSPLNSFYYGPSPFF